MCIHGPEEIKKDIYNVMTSSRELANYCQESVKSLNSNNIADSLSNFHLKNSIEFLVKSFNDKDRFRLDSKYIRFDNLREPQNKAIHNKVIDYINTYFKM